MKSIPSTFFLCAFSISTTLPAQAADWLHYRGPMMNGTSMESDWDANWQGAATIRWEKDLGIGSSSFTVQDDRAYTMGNKDNQDIVYCLDLKTGRELWTHTTPTKFEERMFEGGTASTPTIDGDRVYVLSYDGQFACLDHMTGKVNWKKHLIKDFQGRLSSWKYSSSPLVAGDLVFLDTGSEKHSTVALNKISGDLIWSSGNQKAGYASPVPFSVGSTRGVLMFKAKEMLGLNMATGKELFSIPWESAYDVNASSPLASGNRLFISSGYKNGRGAMYQIDGPKPKQLWLNEDIKTKMNSCAAWQGYIYGISERKAMIMCIDARDGKTKWEAKGGGQFGNLIVAGGRLIILSDAGELLIAPATPDGFKPLAKAKILSDRCWVQPTLAHGTILCRNNKGKAVAVNVTR